MDVTLTAQRMRNMDQDDSEKMQDYPPEPQKEIPTGVNVVDPQKDIEKEYKDQWYVLEQFKSSVRQDNGFIPEATASQGNSSHTEDSGALGDGENSGAGSALTTSGQNETDSTIANRNDANSQLTNDQVEHEQWFALTETGSSGSSQSGSQRSSLTLTEPGPLTTIETAILSQSTHGDSGNESSSSVKSDANCDPAQQLNQTDINVYKEQWYVLQQLKASIKDMPLNESSSASKIERQSDRSPDLTFKEDTRGDPAQQLGNSSIHYTPTTGDVSEATDQAVNTRLVSVVPPNQWVIKDCSGSDANIGNGTQLGKPLSSQANQSLTREDKSLSSQPNHSFSRLDSLGESSVNSSSVSNSNTMCKSNDSFIVSVSEQHTKISHVDQRTSPSSVSDVSVEFVSLPDPSPLSNQLPKGNSQEVVSTNDYNSHTSLPSSFIQSPVEQNALNSYSSESISGEAEYSQRSNGDFWVEPTRVSDHIGTSSLLPSRPLTIGRNGSSEAAQQRIVSGADTQVSGQTSTVPVYYPVSQEMSRDSNPNTDSLPVHSLLRPGGSLNGTMLPTERLQPDGRDGVEITAAPWTNVTTSTVQSVTSSPSVSSLIDLDNLQTSPVSSLVSHSRSTRTVLSSGSYKSSEAPQPFVTDSNCDLVDSVSESNEGDELVALPHHKHISQEGKLINHLHSPKSLSSVESNSSNSFDVGLDNKSHSPRSEGDFHYAPIEQGTCYLQGRPKTQVSLFQNRAGRPFGMVSEDEESSPVTKLLGPSFKAAEEMLERLKKEKLRSYSDSGSGSDSSKQDDLAVSALGSSNREALNGKLDGRSTFRDTSLLRVRQSDDKILSSYNTNTSYDSHKLVKRQYESSMLVDSDAPHRGPGFAWSMPIPSSDFQRTKPTQTTSIFTNEKPSANGSITSVKQNFSERSVEDMRQKERDQILAEIEARYPVGGFSKQPTRSIQNGVGYHHKLAWQGSSSTETSLLESENVKVPSRLSSSQVEEIHVAPDVVTVEEDKHLPINNHHSQIQLSSPSYGSAVEASSDNTDDLLSYEPVLEGDFHYLKKNHPGTGKESGKSSNLAKPSPMTSDNVLTTSSGKSSSLAKPSPTTCVSVLRTSSGFSLAKTPTTGENILRTSYGKSSSLAKISSITSDSVLRTSSGKSSSLSKISTTSDSVLRTSSSGKGYVPKQEVKPQRSPERVGHISINHGFSASSFPAREADVISRTLPYRSLERGEVGQLTSMTNGTVALEQGEDKALRDYHLSLGAGTVTPLTDFSPIDYGSYLRPTSSQVNRTKYEESNLTDAPSIEEQSICSLSEDVLSIQDDEEIMQRNTAHSLNDIELQSESSASDMYRPLLKEETLSCGKTKESTSFGIYDIRKSSGPGSTNRRRRAMGLKAIPPRAKLQESRDLSVYVSGSSTQNSQNDSQRTNLPQTSLPQTQTSVGKLLHESTATSKDSPSVSESSPVVEDHIYVRDDDLKENIARIPRRFNDHKKSTEKKLAWIQKKNDEDLNTVKNRKSKSKTHHRGKLLQHQHSDVHGKLKPQKKPTRSSSQALIDSQDLNELWGRFQRSLRDESPDSEGSNSTLSRLSKLSSMLSQPLPRRVSTPSSQHSSLTSGTQTKRYTSQNSGRSLSTSSLSDTATTLSLDDAFVEPAVKTSVTRQLKLRQLLKNVRPDNILNGPVLERCRDDSTTETTTVTTGISTSDLKTVSEDSSDTLTSLEPRDAFPHWRPRTVPQETRRLRSKKDGTKCPCICGAARGRDSVSQDRHQDIEIQTIDSGMHDVGVNFPTPRTSPRDKGRQGKRERTKAARRMNDAATQTRDESLFLAGEQFSNSDTSIRYEKEEKQPKTPTKSKRTQLQEERYVITQQSPRDERLKQQVKTRPRQITPRKQDDRPVPCQNSPDLVTRKLQEKKRGDGKSGPVWFHPVSNKHYSRPSEPLRETKLNQTRVDTFDTTIGAPHSLQKLSLQEAFLYAKPSFIKKSRDRLEKVTQKRKDFELKKHQKENLASNDQEIDEDDVLRDSPKDDVAKHSKYEDVDKRLRFAYSEHLHQPKRRQMTRKEMLELNKRLYSKLPEVKEMQEKKRRQAFYCSNLQRARLYGKRVRNRLKQHGH